MVEPREIVWLFPSDAEVLSSVAVVGGKWYCLCSFKEQNMVEPGILARAEST